MKPDFIWQEARLIWFESEHWLGQLDYAEDIYNKFNESNVQNSKVLTRTKTDK